ncbi:MAG: AAA family ATPase [Puniceicoccales bacterium]|jgi:hypothetical protein|nr:AAA family ATPase [Puniceicoccales bacterium]
MNSDELPNVHFANEETAESDIGSAELAALQRTESRQVSCPVTPQRKTPASAPALPTPDTSLPPHSLDAERCVLSCIVGHGVSVPDNLTPDDFYDPKHADVFAACRSLHGRGEGVDEITICDELRRTGNLEYVGGAVYIGEICNAVEVTAHFEGWVKTVKDTACRRRSMVEANRLLKLLGDGGDPLAILQGIDRLKNHAYTFEADDDWEIKCGSDLNGKEIPMPPAILKNILLEGCIGVLAGPSKARKTFTLLDLALSVATGTKWMGCLDTVLLPTSTLYMNFEIPDGAFERRIQRTSQEKGLSSIPANFFYLPLRGKKCDLERDRAKIVRIIKQIGPKLVIFDPIYKALGNRDENKTGDVAEMLAELETICTEAGVALIFAHHYAKGNSSFKNDGERSSGSGVFTRYPDAIIEMVPHGKEEDAYIVKTVLREFKRIPPFCVRLRGPDSVTYVLAPDLDVTDAKGAKAPGVSGRPKKHDPQQIIDYLQSAGKPMTQEEFRVALPEIPRSTLQDYLKGLTALGQLERGEDKSYSLPQHTSMPESQE